MLHPVRRRWRAWKALREGKLDWLGGPLHFPDGSLVALQIVRTGSWEHDITRLIGELVRPGTVVFDVGANIGATALPVLDGHRDVRVISCEPSPTILPFLTRTHAQSRFRDRWELVPKAVTDSEPGEVSFTVFEGGGGDVYEGLRDTGRAGGRRREVRVPTTRVDDEWKARGKPPVSLLKVDVEGAELGVLAGAKTLLDEARPVVFTEWCPKNFIAYGAQPEAMLDVAERLNYDAYLVPDLYRVTISSALPYQLAMRENLLLLPRG